MAGEASDADPADGPSPGDTADPAGIGTLAARLVESLHGAFDTRVRIAALEFAEERERAKQRLALLLVVAIAGAFALFAVQALLVALAWDRFGWRTLAVLTALWAAVAAFGAWRLAQSARREQRPFAATLAELDRDRTWLVDRLRRSRR